MTDREPVAPVGHEVLLPTASGTATRRALVHRLRRLRGPVMVTGAVLSGAAVTGLLVPPLLGAVVDSALDDSSHTLVSIVAALACVTVVQAVLTGASTVLVARTGERFLASLREDVMDRALSLSLEQVEAAGTGDLVSRVGGDVEAISDSVRVAVPALAISALSIGLTVVGLAVLDWRLALAGLAALPVQVLATRWYLRRSRPMYAAERVAIGARAQQLTETIGGAETLRALRLGPSRAVAAERSSSAAMDRTLVAARTRARFFAHLNSAELIGLSCTLVVGFLTVRAGIVSVGAATAAALYFQRLFDPIGLLLSVLDTFQDAGAALSRLVGVTDLPEPEEPTDPPTPAYAGVDVDHVSFAYAPGREVVSAVDLRLVPGERVAVVGQSGAGKSTLVKLIAGIHHPGSGTIRLGGVPLDALGHAGVRRQVVLVMQDVHVFAGTVAEDLRLARPDATDADLWAAVRAVGAGTWIEHLDLGLDTPVGAGGRSLGATRAQQLAMARVALTAAPVVVLDEATAEAGSVGARVLEQAAMEITAGRTTLVVAHRLTQAESADRIVVMDRGSVVETGSHADLVESGGAYASLWAAWSDARVAAVDGLRRPER